MGGLANTNHGSQIATADSVIGVKSKPIRVFSATWLSSGGGAGELVLRNGSTNSDTVIVETDGTQSNTAVINFEGGLLFPDGCFFDKDSNVTSVVVEYREEL